MTLRVNGYGFSFFYEKSNIHNCSRHRDNLGTSGKGILKRNSAEAWEKLIGLYGIAYVYEKCCRERKAEARIKYLEAENELLKKQPK